MSNNTASKMSDGSPTPFLTSFANRLDDLLAESNSIIVSIDNKLDDILGSEPQDGESDKRSSPTSAVSSLEQSLGDLMHLKFELRNVLERLGKLI